MTLTVIILALTQCLALHFTSKAIDELKARVKTLEELHKPDDSEEEESEPECGL